MVAVEEFEIVVDLLIGMVNEHCRLAGGLLSHGRKESHRRVVSFLVQTGFLAEVAGRPDVYAWTEKVLVAER
jgi:hypothetical protein